jgi:hypothetical protein
MSYGAHDVFALCLNWWKNASRNMFYHCWEIISFSQEVLIYGCLMEPMMFLLLLLIFSKGIRNQNKLLLDHLKH